MSDFSRLKTWVSFIGYGRSGHSFIGSALCAHPSACITHEADAINRSSQFPDRDVFFANLFRHANEIANTGRLTDNRWGKPYEQYIEGQIKSDSSTLQVIGNKNGSIDTKNDIEQFYNRMRQFQKYIGKDIQMKFIMVLRNPYDAGLLDEKVYSLLQAVSESGLNTLVLRHEEFIFDPRSKLIELMDFLGLEVIESYLNSVINRTMKTIHRARYKIKYDRAQIELIQRAIDSTAIFKGYSYDS